MRYVAFCFALGLIVGALACTEDDPEATPLPDMQPDAEPTATPDANPDMLPDAMPDMAPDASPDMMPDPTPEPEPVVCEPLETDYSPGADDSWAECISDDNTYHQFEMTISSIGRVGAVLLRGSVTE